MGRPAKLPDEAVLDTWLVGNVAGRSNAGPIDISVQLDRAIDPLLDSSRARALGRAVKVTALSKRIASVNADEGQRRVADTVRERPFPHYGPATARPGHLIRVESDGTGDVSSFIQRPFRPSND